MEENKVTPPVFPEHVEETVRSIARLRAEHHESATRLQRIVAKLTAGLASPKFPGVITFVVIGWIGLNLAVATSGARPVDPPPFLWLSDAISLV